MALLRRSFVNILKTLYIKVTADGTRRFLRLSEGSVRLLEQVAKTCGVGPQCISFRLCEEREKEKSKRRRLPGAEATFGDFDGFDARAKLCKRKKI